MNKIKLLAILLPITTIFISCEKPLIKEPSTVSQGSSASVIGPANYNVMLIVVDDLRWWSLRALWQQERVERKNNNTEPITPNIDLLMSESVTFSKAYCPGIACTPSRTSLLTGRYPNATGIYRVGNDWSSAISPNQTMIWSFDQKGYAVSGAGKIFHDADEETINRFWFNKPYLITQQEATLPAGSFSGRNGNIPLNGYGWRSIKDEAVPATQDHLAVDFCLKQMRAARQYNDDHPAAAKPFFIACGIRRPHAPLIVPDSELDRQFSPVHPKRLPVPADFMDLPVEARDLKNGCSGESNDDVIDRFPAEWNKYMQAYAGAVSYADKEVGRIITGLKNQGFAENTIVVLISDNGFHLGEKHHVHKNTYWEEALRVPMIWKIPGNSANANKICDNPVDLMSIYKTLASQLNLPTPHTLSGKDLSEYLKNPLIADPNARAITQGSQYKPGTNQIEYSATVRTNKWRLIQYDGSTAKEELYDEVNEAWENTNKRATTDLSVLKELRAALPPQSGYKSMIGKIRCD